MKSTLLFVPALCLAALTAGSVTAEDAKPKPHPTGYTDTPFLPGDKWRVHDDTRPRPEVVTPGTTASEAPSDAIVLFGGKDLSEWTTEDGKKPAGWTVKDGYFEVPPKGEGSGTIATKRTFGDMQLHIEWRSPAEVKGDSQGRGNSGIFIMENYELQVLDSYDNKSYADGQASALYGWKPPLVNACRKPGEWQTYEVIFEAPRWDEQGKQIKKAYITVIHNGVVTQNHMEYLGGTGHKKVAQYHQHPDKMRLKLQDHGNPVGFRNIWVRELNLASQD
ncbi:MAG: DUF1080 domain-containing protein [Akkermansiaceae bacterium]|nr:DUF1080 domain-containing protein [Verrucomicrobiae bacterium]MCP5554850.1 DUF1080 domain-containing protein [Akkermansiaceae bacterium]